MKRKSVKIAAVAACTLALLWCGMFVTDFVRCSSLREPVFVIPWGETADDGGSGSYIGLGYRVEIEKNISAEYGTQVEAVEMRVLGRVIAASIT